MTRNNEVEYECVINFQKTLRDAVSVMSKCDWKLCVIIDDNKKVFGIFTEGDYRKVAVTKQSFDIPVAEVANRDFVYLDKGYQDQDAVRIFSSSYFDEIPILDDGKLVQVLHSDTVLKPKAQMYQSAVVIMAGGKGTRLDPFTRILPKPLIPVGSEPAIQVILEKFLKDGFSKFFLSVNEKATIIKSYFSSVEKKYDITFITEEKQLGTAGALSLMTDLILEDFFVCNCDILMKVRHNKIMDYHRSNGHDLTVVAALQNHQIDYGVCKFGEDGNFLEIEEKPKFQNLVVTGLYALSLKVLDFIPRNEHLDMPNLIKRVQKEGLKVGIFPISEDSWSDIGQWEEFSKLLNTL